MLKINTKQKKIEFLVGIRRGTRRIEEVMNLPVIFSTIEDAEKSASKYRYPEAQQFFVIPDNGRKKPDLLKKINGQQSNGKT